RPTSRHRSIPRRSWPTACCTSQRNHTFTRCTTRPVPRPPRIKRRPS
ncbi:uncharacterized protein METZ01_LOCUS140327, partial [marine metagenome]